MTRLAPSRLLARALCTATLALSLGVLGVGCSTMPLFTVEEYRADAGAQDASADGARPDGGVAAGRPDGGFFPFDGGPFPVDGGPLPFDGGPFPFDGGFDASGLGDGGLADFDYECTLYGISRQCRPARELPANCSGAAVGEVCFNLPGFGLAQMYLCQADPAGRRRWTPSYVARCAYNCPVELPSASLFSLNTAGCGTRPPRPCERGASGTTQDAVDAVLREAAQRCGLATRGTGSIGMSVNDQGCPEWVHASLPRVPAAARDCISAALETIRFDCTPECSVASTNALL